MHLSKKSYLWLFFTHFFISAFTFGGGYVVIPMIRKHFVQKKHCLTEEELLNLSAIAQSCPGAIAVNLSVLTGYKIAGFLGAFLSMTASILPPILILSAICFFYTDFRNTPVISSIFQILSAFVCAYILDFVIDMAKLIQKEHSLFLNFLAITAFFVSLFHFHIIFFLLLCCVFCCLRTWIFACSSKTLEK